MKKHLWAGIALSLAAGTTQAPAAIIYDQGSFMAVPECCTSSVGVTTVGQPNASSGTSKLIQTITAGESGLLSAIDLQAVRMYGSDYSSGTFRLSLFDGDGAAGGSLLGSANFDLTSLMVYGPGADYTRAFRFDTSAFNYVVTPGQLFSFGVEVDAPLGSVVLFPTVLWDLNAPAPAAPSFLHQYDGGVIHVSQNDGAYGTYTAIDTGFRTYVDDSFALSVGSAVPEPSNWAMLIAGFAGVGVMARPPPEKRIRAYRLRLHAYPGILVLGAMPALTPTRPPIQGYSAGGREGVRAGTA